MDLKKNNSFAKGFTLVELLVVIAVIALLLTIITPALTRAREMARRIVCATHERALLQALHAYAVSHDDAAYPIREEYFPEVGRHLELPWDITIAPYLGSDYADSEAKVFVCPSDRKPRGPLDNDPVFRRFRRGDVVLPRSYMLNGALSNRKVPPGGTAIPHTWYTDQTGRPERVSNMSMPSNTYWVYEHHIGQDDENWTNPTHLPTADVMAAGCVQGINYWPDWHLPPAVKGIPHPARYGGPPETSDQHRDGGNWGFFDGSVRFIRHIDAGRIPNVANNPRAYLHAFEGLSFPYDGLPTSSKRRESGLGPNPY